MHVSLCQEGRTVFTGLEVSQSFDLAGQLTHNCLVTIISLPVLSPGNGSNTLYVRLTLMKGPWASNALWWLRAQQQASRGGLAFQLLCATGLAKALTH